MPDIEIATINAFIAREKRERWLMKLADPKKRRAFLDRLNHCNDFDGRYVTAVSPGAQIDQLLRDRGTPEQVHIMSDVAEKDGQTMSLGEALESLDSDFFGTIICCVPGRLAFYYGEGGEECLILHRPVDTP